MSREITYRSYILSDYPYLIDIMDKAWGYSQFYSKTLGNLMAEHDLLERLAFSSFSCIALDGDVPIGFLLGRRLDGEKNAVYENQARKVLKDMKHHLGAPVYAVINERIKDINTNLVRTSGRHFDAEAQILVVSEGYAGNGIGQEMLNRFKEYLRVEGFKNFYACTDTESYFEFCEANGFERCGHEKFGIPFVSKSKVELYLYECTID